MTTLDDIAARDAEWDAEFTGANWRADDVLRDRRYLLGLVRGAEALNVERLVRAMASDAEMFRLLWPDENGLILAAERIAAEYARLTEGSDRR